MQLLTWWNLIFVLPFLAALGLLLLQALGALPFEADTDVDQDASLSDDSSGGAVRALSFLGLGRVPVSIVLMTFCFLWGVTGWASNQVLQPILRLPAVFVWPSIAVALTVSIASAGFVVRLLSRLMPSTETYATSHQDLVGKRAEALFEISERFGKARLHDAYGNLLDVSCRVQPGDSPVPSGTSVVLMRYDNRQQAYLVRLDPLDKTQSD